jgi:hypothetical protein
VGHILGGADVAGERAGGREIGAGVDEQAVQAPGARDGGQVQAEAAGPMRQRRQGRQHLCGRDSRRGGDPEIHDSS